MKIRSKSNNIHKAAVTTTIITNSIYPENYNIAKYVFFSSYFTINIEKQFFEIKMQ